MAVVVGGQKKGTFVAGATLDRPDVYDRKVIDRTLRSKEGLIKYHCVVAQERPSVVRLAFVSLERFPYKTNRIASLLQYIHLSCLATL
jgi:hypothetical protein